MKIDLTVVLRNEPKLVAVNDWQIQGVLDLADHLQELLLAEVHDHRSLGACQHLYRRLGHAR